MSALAGAAVAATFLGESAVGLAGLLLRRRPRAHYATFPAEASVPEEPPAHWGQPVEIGYCGPCARPRPAVGGLFIGCGHAATS